MPRRECPTGVRFLARGCGHHPVIPIGCGSPLCPKCEKQRTKKNLRKWGPVLRRFKSPRMITLTIASGFDAAERVDTLNESFRRLLDTRMGSRARGHLLAETLAYIDNMKAPDDKKAHHRISAERFMTEVERLEIKFREGWRERAELVIDGLPNTPDPQDGAQFKFRHCIGKGISAFEATWDDKHIPSLGYHVHRHLTLDGTVFIPQVILTVLWRNATNGDGYIVDIRRLRDRDSRKWEREAIKYCCKMWEIPDDHADELEAAIRGLKRIWPLGGLKPIVPDPEPCHNCGSIHCRCDHVATASNDDKLPGTMDYFAEIEKQPAIIHVGVDQSEKRLGLIWHAERIRPETAEWLQSSLRRANATLYQEKAPASPVLTPSGTTNQSNGPP